MTVVGGGAVVCGGGGGVVVGGGGDGCVFVWCVMAVLWLVLGVLWRCCVGVGLVLWCCCGGVGFVLWWCCGCVMGGTTVLRMLNAELATRQPAEREIQHITNDLPKLLSQPIGFPTSVLSLPTKRCKLCPV